MDRMEPTNVDVICQHTKDGDVIPMRIRVTDEDGIYQAYTIKQYRKISRDGAYTTPDGIFVCNKTMIFECKITVFKQTKTIRLYYEFEKGIWKIAS
ncbi:MAG: hypothetical protein K6E64_00045 [Lachnospiraceae bacterium]|nr:hypothetical protein [Lachnospiraceae bacterium]